MTTYSNPRMQETISDWPYGSMRTTATFSIETVPGRGQRAVRVTIDPKTGKPTAPKKLTFARKMRIVDGDDGRTYIAELTMYGHVSVMNGDMKYEHESVHEGDPRHEAMVRLFD